MLLGLEEGHYFPYVSVTKLMLGMCRCVPVDVSLSSFSPSRVLFVSLSHPAHDASTDRGSVGKAFNVFTALNRSLLPLLER